MYSTVAGEAVSALASSSPDSDAANILLAVLALLIIVAVMFGVVICIIKKSNRDIELYNEQFDDEEETDDMCNDDVAVEIEETKRLTKNTSFRS